MTPCFIHTPNMTNKWENFNPNDYNENGELKSNIQNGSNKSAEK